MITGAAGGAQGRLFEGALQDRSASFERSQPEGDDGDSTPLGHRSRSPIFSKPQLLVPASFEF